jgi:hypothetical protein
MYNCSYTCSEEKRRKKNRKQIRNVCTITHTRIFKANIYIYIKHAVTTSNNVSELSLYSRSVLSETLLSTVVD